MIAFNENCRKKSLAFTVVEFAVVMIIISLTFTTVSPAIIKLVEIAETKSESQKVTEMQTDIDKFCKENGRFPDSLEEIYGEVPLDAWGNPYQYLNHSKAKGIGKLRKDKNLVPINSDYDLYSMGPDGETASPLTASISKDDIIRARNGMYVGTAVDY